MHGYIIVSHSRWFGAYLPRPRPLTRLA